MTIKIKNKEYPIRPTMWALITFKREKGKMLTDLTDGDLEDLMYYSYLCVKGACRQDDVDFTFTFEEYLEQVEGDPTDSLLAAKGEEIKKKLETR
jgi:hypothetical protein